MRRVIVGRFPVIAVAVLLIGAGCSCIMAGDVHNREEYITNLPDMPVAVESLKNIELTGKLEKGGNKESENHPENSSLSPDNTARLSSAEEEEPEGANKLDLEDNNDIAVSTPETALTSLPTEMLSADCSWGKSLEFLFTVEVIITNVGDTIASNVWVDLPMLENRSPYQETVLKTTNHDIKYIKGRTASFTIGDLEPGKTELIIFAYDIKVKPFTISSTNEVVEEAKLIYEELSGSGSCYELAKSFVGRCLQNGIDARIVNGFAGAETGFIGKGVLEERHSWAEFYVEELGWVPVDLTFEHFAALPGGSHIVENYLDQSIRVYHLDGTLNIEWLNTVL